MFAKESGKGLAAVWFKFFLDAGIPPSDAGNYAATFTEHRIQSDMLGELTKDYLADMGITVLGDVIAILKHARIENAKMSKEQALKCSGLAVQSSSASSSSVNVPLPPATKQLPAATAAAKRTNTKTAAAAVANGGLAATSSLHINASRSSARSTGVGVGVIDEPRRAKTTSVAAADLTTTAEVSAGKAATIQRPQEKPATQVEVNSRRPLVNKRSLTVALHNSLLSSQKSSVAAAVSSQSLASANDLSLKKTVVVASSSSSSAAAASKTPFSSSVFSRLGDKLSASPPSLRATATVSTAEPSGLTKTVRDRLGPATRDAAVESSSAAAPSVQSRLGDSISQQPALLVPTKRKLVGETVTLTTTTKPAATAAAAAAAAVSMKSSIKSRLGDPVMHDSRPPLMIPTKRKLTIGNTLSGSADETQAKTAKFSSTKLPVKSRLGEPAATLESKLMTNRTQDAADDASCVELPQNKTVFSRLGRI